MRRSIQITHMYEKNRNFENEDVFYSVMTRFNIKWEQGNMVKFRQNPKFYREWLTDRVDLFRTNCLAPMVQQSIPPHAWFLLFDADITRPIVELLDEILDHDWIVPLFLTGRKGEIEDEFREVIQRRFGDRGFEHSCCVRLDSDDSLNLHYMAVLDHVVGHLRQEWNDQEAQTINFPYGAAHLRGRYLVEHQPRQFFAVFDPIELAKTPYRTGHRHIGKVSDVWDVFTPQPMFIYQAHESNISNVASYGRKKHQTFGDIPLLLEQFGLRAPAVNG